MLPLLADNFCRVYRFSTYLITVQADWISVMVALDRVVAVVCPNWYRLNCTRKSVWPFIMGLWLVLVCVGAPGMAYYRVRAS